MSAKFMKVVAVCALLLMSAGVRLQAQSTKPSDNYDQLFERYLQEARQAGAARSATDAWAWMDGLTLDRRARALNDLITIRVIESIAGAGTADSALSKDSSASLGVAALFGLEKKLPGAMDPAALVSARSNTDFQGSGTTTRASELTALITARVSDVLPSGDLVVEGIREIEINGDRQVVVLSGVVRPSDISPNNVILSTAIGQLRIRYFGRGLMKDNLQPGWLIRILNKVF
jgi:flagellar L-ring protein precursor FlgH